MELRHLGHLLRHLKSKQFSPFFVISEEDEQNHGSLRYITKEVISAMIYESTFKLDTLEVRPSLELARTIISLCLSKDGEMYPISGFPRYLGPNTLQNRSRKKDGTKTQQTPGQVSTKGTNSKYDEAGDKAPTKMTAQSSGPEARSVPWSSNETLPIQPPDEDIPFWARGFRNSGQVSIDEDFPGTPSSIAETVEDMVEEEMLELAKRESLKTSPTVASRPQPLSLRSLEVNDSAHPITSWSPPAYQLRQDHERLPRSFQDGFPTVHSSVSSPDLHLNQVPSPRPEPNRWRSAGGVTESSPIITDLTEEEILEIGRMRSVELH
jgi:hypothetical protein